MKFNIRKTLSISLITLLLVVSFLSYISQKANAALLSSASIQLTDPRPSNASTSWVIKYTPTATTFKCIDIIISDTTGHIVLTTNPATTAPATLATNGSSSTSVTGGGFTSPGSWTYTHTSTGIMQYDYSTGDAGDGSTPAVITIGGITNPSVGTFYAQIATYSTDASHVCSGLVDTSNVMALVTTGGVATTVSVDPTLSFSVAGYSSAVNGAPAPNPITDALRIPFGNVAAGGSATQAAQLLTTSTNAAGGYSIYIRNTQLLTDSNADSIAAQTCTGSDCSTVAHNMAFSGSTSTSSFGFTTDSGGGGNPITSNQFVGLTTSNVVIDHKTAATNAGILHVEYQLELSNVQPPGTYSNVITYTATPTY